MTLMTYNEYILKLNDPLLSSVYLNEKIGAKIIHVHATGAYWVIKGHDEIIYEYQHFVSGGCNRDDPKCVIFENLDKFYITEEPKPCPHKPFPIYATFSASSVVEMK